MYVSQGISLVVSWSSTSHTQDLESLSCLSANVQSIVCVFNGVSSLFLSFVLLVRIVPSLTLDYDAPLTTMITCLGLPGSTVNARSGNFSGLLRNTFSLSLSMFFVMLITLLKCCRCYLVTHHTEFLHCHNQSHTSDAVIHVTIN